MSENPISITKINDFIFCPISIYFHSLEEESDKLSYQDEYQINGTASHEKSDNAEYSTRKSILQGVPVYCEKYDLFGKIDIFDENKRILTERKKKIKKIYNGYIFQLYAQYFALIEMGYTVNEIALYSMDDNKKYPIKKPEDDMSMLQKFEKTISDIKLFSYDDFHQDNIQKCTHCIYEPLCSYSRIKE